MPAPEQAPVVLQYISGVPTPEEYRVEENVYGQTHEPWAIALEEMQAKAIEYGYDREVAKEWFTNSGAAWEELTKKHDKEEMELGQQHVREASDYVKGIFDNMVIDLQQQQVSNMEEFNTNVDEFVS